MSRVKSNSGIASSPSFDELPRNDFVRVDAAWAIAHWAAVMPPPERQRAMPRRASGAMGVAESYLAASTPVPSTGSGTVDGSRATEAERGASPWGSASLASGHEHLDDAPYATASNEFLWSMLFL